MSPDLRELFDNAGRTPPSPHGWDPDDVVARGRRARTRRQALAGAATLGAAAIVVGGAVVVAGLPGSPRVAPLGPTSPSATGTPTSSPSGLQPEPTGASSSPTGLTSPSPTVPASCTAADVSLTVQEPQGAAGTTYYPVLIKAVPGASCTISGVPSVAVVVDGDAVRAAVSGTPSESAVVAGSSVASFAVGIAESGNYDPGVCRVEPAQRLDVVLPGDLTGATVPVDLPDGVTVCTGTSSTTAGQVQVLPVVKGPDGT